MYVKRHPVKAN